MKQFFFSLLEQYRHYTLFLAMILCVATPCLALDSDEINAAILVEGSVPVKWTDDQTHPSSIDGQYLQIGKAEQPCLKSISLTYSSSYPTELTFQYIHRLYSSSEYFKIIIDGIEEDLEYSWSASSYRKVIPSGNHTIEFVSFYEYEYTEYYNSIKDLRVLECKELEASCLKEGSLPLKFVNDPENPWITDNGYIRSTTFGIENAKSIISTSFNIDQTSLFSFEYKSNDYYSYSSLTVIIDDIEYDTFSTDKWDYISFVLYPGNHSIEFRHYNRYTWESLMSNIRNVRLDQTWYNVDVQQPGTFSNRLIQELKDKNLQDAELVKIKGSLNDNDWATIKQLSGIKAIDFTETNIESIPDEAFKNLSYLSTVMLPGTLKEIGNSSFINTNFYQVEIPSSVETIGMSAWKSTPLQFISFKDNSKLTYIGHSAFSGTNLIEFKMPDSVNLLGSDDYNRSYLFFNCKELKKLHISENLSSIPTYFSYECSSLEEIYIPENVKSIKNYAFYNTNLKNVDLPIALEEIGDYAFYGSSLENIVIPQNVSSFGRESFSNCKNLKTVNLNSHCWDMYNDFNYCTALETIVLPCATPPSIKYDPFDGVSKANVKLIVPDFALQSYRTDPYWYRFTDTQAGDEASINDYWAIRGSLTLNNSVKMEGNPSIEIMNGGILSLEADMNQLFNELTFNTSELNPGCFLSNSNNINADKLQMNFYVEQANKWYFFSPICDVNMNEVSFPSTDSWVIRYYDGAKRALNNDNSGNWVNVASDGTLKRGQGYIIQANKAGWLYMQVDPNQHASFFGANEVTLTLEDNACETTANAGWNFVANPYPSFYDIYYLDLQAPITVWTGSTYRAYSLNDGDRGDDTFVLRPMQPFFVQKDSENLTASLPLNGRRTSTVIDRTRAPRRNTMSISTAREILNLQLLNTDKDEADDFTRIVLNEEASGDYEINCDASKFMSFDNEVAQLFSLGSDNLPMAINERPYQNGLVQLGVYLPVKGQTYRIRASRADMKAWLYDSETEIEHDLSVGDYEFKASKQGTDNKRFSIRFVLPSSNVENLIDTSVKVSGNNGSINILAAKDLRVQIYSTDGSIILDTISDASELNVEVTKGVYVIKVNGKTFKTIVK